MKKIFIISILIAFPLLVLAQAVITFEKTTHDFGMIKEEDGRVSYDFVFKNDGNAPLVISNVRASCGCTSPSWTKSPVEPGAEGKITVSYNPVGRPGNFNKYVTIQSNATVENEKLHIKGGVIPIPKKDPVTEKFPVDINGLLLETKIIEFNNIEKTATKEKEIKLNNNTNENINVSFINMPKYISVSPLNIILAPKSERTINLIFDSNKSTEWGPITQEFYLLVNNSNETLEKNKLIIKANIVDDFSKMTIVEKRSAPILEIQKRTISLGRLNQGAKQQGYFTVKNIGEKPLAIRKVINDNPEITFETEQLNIRNGKTADIKFTVAATELKQGEHNRTVTLQTNDPENAFVVITIEWEVK